MTCFHSCVSLCLCVCVCVCAAAGRTGSCENVLGTHPSKSPTPSQDTPPPSPSRYEPILQHILNHMEIHVCVCVYVEHFSNRLRKHLCASPRHSDCVMLLNWPVRFIAFNLNAEVLVLKEQFTQKMNIC